MLWRPLIRKARQHLSPWRQTHQAAVGIRQHLMQMARRPVHSLRAAPSLYMGVRHEIRPQMSLV